MIVRCSGEDRQARRSGWTHTIGTTEREGGGVPDPVFNFMESRLGLASPLKTNHEKSCPTRGALSYDRLTPSAQSSSLPVPTWTRATSGAASRPAGTTGFPYHDAPERR